MTSWPETLANSTPACQTAKRSKRICKILISIWKCDLKLRTKINSIYSELTSSPEVRSFLDRQPVNTKTDYQRLRKALIKEFADPESDQGLVAALETRQGRHEPPQAYYSRLRQAYFGTRNDSDMEDELNFKTLFLRHLHPGISHHLGVLACPRTMNTQQLRDLVQKAYYKQKMASEKSAKTPAVLDFNTQHHELALEGTQRQDKR